MCMQREPEIISYNLLEMCLKSEISVYDMNISHFIHESRWADSCTQRPLPISDTYISQTELHRRKFGLLCLNTYFVGFTLSLFTSVNFSQNNLKIKKYEESIGPKW